MVRRPTANRVVRENRAWGFESPSLRQICSLLCCFGVDGTIFFNEEKRPGFGLFAWSFGCGPVPSQEPMWGPWDFVVLYYSRLSLPPRETT